MENPFKRSTYAEAIGALAERFGPRTALVFREERYSFADLKREADKASARLAGLGLKPGDKIAILMPNRPEFLWYWLGAAQLGLVAVMLNTRLRRDEIAYQLAQSDSRAVVVPGAGAFRDFIAELAELAPAVRSGTPGQLASEALPELRWVIACDPPEAGYAGVTDWSGKAQAGLPFPEMADDPDQPAIIAYSSGTTALPKGAMITHCVWRKAWDIGIRVDLDEDDCLYMSIPLFGSMATMNGVMPYWARGAKVVLGEQFDAGHCLKAIEQERVTGMHVLPPIMRQILAHPDFGVRDISSWRISYTLSIDPDVLNTIADVIGVPAVMTGYGMTETTTVVTRNRWDDPREIRHATQGWALPDIEIRIVDPEGLKDLAAGETGEIWVRGYCVMAGYYKKPEETARMITDDGWLRTGDLGTMDATGRVTLVGRLGDTYKSRGFNVAPAEVEHVLQNHPAVHSCAIVGIPDERHGAVGVAFVVAEGARPTEDEILRFLAPKVASYKMPEHVLVVDELPLTSGTGKVQKFKLREQAEERLGRTGAPKTQGARSA
ncbi:class I adenylate-forming enzyme family protein [Ferruginivarius sediminum]|uniref:Long-chain fatty acid--CoA ligase n=1 Tax=Ferruginivarius sediminum TaxID=2661937 RepID=A0A369TAM8_9PROT|nr:class I adenylate-forming enzyme family protein [Ferruginivarius sediminum]RDD62340.1 long-chain fatty acid--CoA ligase [Ferruginivarius sediminum]